ncbi:DUF5709 domain-containing protein [Mycolicibacterium doricum]|uniref:DUF5709 domain-containing protein n=1 Tax=Mycolicibacterium doricum TaxID=126673 RepID=UPI001C660AA9|nr:DUF5709 domain-containing protein [Mycolicibacterium doricum]
MRDRTRSRPVQHRGGRPVDFGGEPDSAAVVEGAERAVGFPRRGEVGGPRAGRLVAPDQGFGEDDEADLVATDVGIDGGGASAEEAAVHVIDEDDPAED